MNGKWIEATTEDSVESVAFRHGLLPATIWQHSENAKLRQSRSSMHVLQQGDRLFVPDMKTKSVSCATGQLHAFRRYAVPSRLPLKLALGSLALANRPCTFEFAGLAPVSSVTDSEGYVVVPVMPDVGKACLTVELDNGQRVVIDLAPRGLDPVDTPRGIESRLRNLGLLATASSGVDDLAIVLALGRFQVVNGLPVSGAADELTRTALKRLHGS